MRTEHRTIQLETRRGDAGSRTFQASFSSEEPIARFWGVETLSHAPGAVDLTRAQVGGLPFLFNHDSSQAIGLVKDLRVDGRKLRGTLHLFSTQRANEALAMIDGGLRNVSVGYSPLEVKQTGTDDAGTPQMLVTRWSPFELSYAPVPADTSVGIGRSLHKGKLGMSETQDDVQLTPPADSQSRSQRRAASPGNERERATAIMGTAEQLCTRFNIGEALRIEIREGARRAIEHGDSEERFAGEWNPRVLNAIRASTADSARQARMIGISEDPNAAPEDRFSLVRAIRSMTPGADRTERAGAGREREYSQELQRQIGREPQGMFVPVSALLPHNAQRRDLTVGTAAAGGYLVETELRGLAEVLRPVSRVIGLGASVFNDLRGNVAFPRETAAATMSWVTEGGAAAEGGITFDQLNMAPKSVTGWVDFSRKLMKQSSMDVETVVMRNLTKGIANAVDAAAINGSGVSNQPLGILGASGVSVVSLGASGAAPSWDKLVDLQKEVEADSALEGRLAFLGNAAGRAKLMKTPRQSAGVEGSFILSDPFNSLLGYPFATSENVPSDLTKSGGTALSALLFGNWANLYIGMWGVVDVLVDPYTGGKEGNTRVIVFCDCDIGVLRGESFSVIKDMVTT